MSISHRIIQIMHANGGSYAGTERLSQETLTERRATERALHNCVRDGLIRIKLKGGGRGYRTHYTLTRKGLDYVRSK